jgi:hypothetical protein
VWALLNQLNNTKGDKIKIKRGSLKVVIIRKKNFPFPGIPTKRYSAKRDSI